MGRQLQTPIEARPKIVQEICAITSSSSKGLTTILKMKDHFPDYTTFYEWLKKDNNLADNYARAKCDQADFLADDMLEIADNTKDANKARVQIDARKWVASKLKPRKYGDKQVHAHEGNVSVTISKDDSKL